MVQNGAKYNRSLKRWELPPGSKPTARMGVQGEDGKPSTPPLGQKAAALLKDEQRKAKTKNDIDGEKKRIENILPSEMQGSEKQIKWATDIRKSLVDESDSVIAKAEERIAKIRARINDGQADERYGASRMTVGEALQSQESRLKSALLAKEALLKSADASAFIDYRKTSLDRIMDDISGTVNLRRNDPKKFEEFKTDLMGRPKINRDLRSHTLIIIDGISKMG